MTVWTNRVLRKKSRMPTDQSDGFMKELARRINVKYSADEFDLGICMDRIGVDEAASIILHAFELFQKNSTK